MRDEAGGRRRLRRGSWLAALLLGGCYGGRDQLHAGETDTAGDSDGDSDGETEGDPAAECGGVGASLAPLRRMTKPQYDNTIRDLFDGAVEPGPQFPVSVIHHEYTNNPAANVVSLAGAEDILLAAEHAAEQVVDGIGTVVPCDPGPACAESFIADFGRRAFRRPLRPQEHDALLDLYATVEVQDGFADGIGTVVAVVLQSPQFLYLVEEGGQEVEPGVVALSDHELATRLSYLLWDTTPDRELLDLAEAGALSDPEQLQAQAQRLLADRQRSAPALDRFFREWIHFDGVPAYDKDTDAFPEYTEALAASMDEELSRFIDGVMRSDTPTLAALLTSPQTEVDATLAAFYGVAAPPEGQWATVGLPADRRPGLLSRPAVLAEHSTGTSSAPIFRGRLVRTQLLCDEIPPPPDDAMANAPSYPEGATERERTEILMEHMDCGTCHALMNPIGLGFEHFDAMGAWRDLDVDGSTVNDLGEIVGGELAGEFEGVPGLAQALAGSEQVQACFADELYRHTLGLERSQVLDCAVGPVQQAFIDSGGDIPSVLLALVGSEAFRLRVIEEEQ